MNCPWCITALPEIEAIEDKYKAKGLVMMDIDHYDTSAADRKRLPDFAKINKMNYPVMLASYKTDSVYKIKAYPTLYIIDKKGNVAFTHMGYHKNLDSIVGPILTKALGK
jgi:thiol-disulfide isomerase/thioredoxin